MGIKTLCLKLLLLRRIRNRLISKNKRRWYIRPVNLKRLSHGQFHSLINELKQNDPEYYFNYFRMTPERFDDLLQRLSPLIQHKANHRFPISPAERLALTLRLLATGDEQKSLAFSYYIGFSTVNVIFRETCKAIWNALHTEFVAVPTKEEFQTISKEFWRLWNFPLCLGAIDGKHVNIKAPNCSGSLFRNYKYSFSIVLMAAADHNYRFILVDVGGYGKQSDGGTFAHSAFGQALEKNSLEIPHSTLLPGSNIKNPHVFLGDEAFPLKQYLMRPYPQKTLTYEKRVFNYRLSRARRVIENAFGILAARWRIFRKPIDSKPENVDWIVKACVALHNYLKTTDNANPPNARYVPKHFVDYVDEAGNDQLGEWRNITQNDTGVENISLIGSNRHSKDSASIRQLTNYFLTAEGSVPWQDVSITR